MTTDEAITAAKAKGLRVYNLGELALPCRPTRQVIDVSSDGEHPPPGPARDALLAAGVTINAVLIVHPAVADRTRAFYEAEVIGGPGRFVMVAEDYSTFAYALRAKLVREVAGTPTHTAER